MWKQGATSVYVRAQELLEQKLLDRFRQPPSLDAAKAIIYLDIQAGGDKKVFTAEAPPVYQGPVARSEEQFFVLYYTQTGGGRWFPIDDSRFFIIGVTAEYMPSKDVRAYPGRGWPSASSIDRETNTAAVKQQLEAVRPNDGSSEDLEEWKERYNYLFPGESV